MSDDFFAPPPFDPATALATLKRTLRDLKFVERGAAFEFNGQPAVRARVDGAELALEVVKRPSRSPVWEPARARDHAMLRKFTDDLKKRVARWADARGGRLTASTKRGDTPAKASFARPRRTTTRGYRRGRGGLKPCGALPKTRRNKTVRPCFEEPP